MPLTVDLREYGISSPRIYRNLSVAELYEHGVRTGGELIASSGALAADSGEKTGRCPGDKRIVEHADSAGDVWWGDVNIKLPERSFSDVRKTATRFLDACDKLYVVDGFAGWDPTHRLKIRVICARPYHALFMHNMLIRPTCEELASFGRPDFVIFNAGQAEADPRVAGLTSKTSVSLSFERGELVILGTQYAGEMKKSIFTLMHYVMPKQGVLSMHCSANVGAEGDVSLFFGLSGTGKTTLSADDRRQLIGDDEHCWTEGGVFNIEGGCYAKCLGLSAEQEPEIFDAIRFGTVLENTIVDPRTRSVDFNDASHTENTRASYPIDFIPNARIPCIAGHPANIILLTCDAFGVLPPVSKLTPEQTMYHFVSGYTAKVAGTEVGVREPQATFSACFGAAFLVWHPVKYAEMLAERLHAHQADAWLVNTGWSGGGYGVGKRISLAHTRAIIDAIHSGELAQTATEKEPVFGLAVPRSVSGVPEAILRPQTTWADAKAYRQAAQHLAGLFRDNFEQFADSASPETAAAGPRLGQTASV